jgi:hypothetical protein
MNGVSTVSAPVSRVVRIMISARSRSELTRSRALSRLALDAWTPAARPAIDSMKPSTCRSVSTASAAIP